MMETEGAADLVSRHWAFGRNEGRVAAQSNSVKPCALPPQSLRGRIVAQTAPSSSGQSSSQVKNRLRKGAVMMIADVSEQLAYTIVRIDITMMLSRYARRQDVCCGSRQEIEPRSINPARALWR